MSGPVTITTTGEVVGQRSQDNMRHVELDEPKVGGHTTLWLTPMECPHPVGWRGMFEYVSLPSRGYWRAGARTDSSEEVK